MVIDHVIHFKTKVKAELPKVWEALTDPKIVKQYFFGTDLVCDWKVGEPICFQGEWEGRPYQDKGVILEYEHNKRLAFSYLSNWSGKEDKPENYLWVCYGVSSKGNETELIVSQSNYDEEKASHSLENWSALMEEMKKLVEG